MNEQYDFSMIFTITEAHPPIPQDILRAAQAAEIATYPYGPFVSVSLAQWALESAYGRTEPKGSNNPFGIKAHGDLPEIAAITHETLHGKYVELLQYFAAYTDVTAAFLDHARVLTRLPCYHAAQHAQTPDEYAHALQGVYATGIPGHPYAAALIGLMREWDLYRYDRR
jgi:flagellum-specific peptidoglycan hydrolase FlgJ